MSLPTPDGLIRFLDSTLRTLHGGAHARRPTPVTAGNVDPPALSEPDARLSAALMRVNHVGEVCAQALYQAQAFTSRCPETKAAMLAAAEEEMDHLAWTELRLSELGGRTSWLNPLWYAGAFGIGLLAGRWGPAISLGFVVETERQVEAHLLSHLDRLPTGDHASRAIVAQMKIDEAAHADHAAAAGGTPLPPVVRGLMHAAGRVMTRTAHYI